MIFSVIIAAYNCEKWIKTAIDSIINQNINFKDNIEIIIVDDYSFDDTVKIAKEYVDKYPENIKLFLNSENKGPGASRNRGLKYAQGKYVNFLDSDDYISKDTFKHVLDFFNRHSNVDLVAIPVSFFENKKGPHYLNDKFEKTQEVNLIENPECYHMTGHSSFIKRSAIGDIEFPDIITSEDVVFVNEILINNPNIGLCSEGKYYYRKRKDQTSIIDNSKENKDYYIPRAVLYFKALIDKSLKTYYNVPEFIQNIILYDLRWILKTDVRNILTESEIREYKTILKDILADIDDETIYKHSLCEDYIKQGIFLLKSGEIISDLEFRNVFIDIYEIINDRLYVLANYPKIEDCEIEVYINQKKIDTNPVRFPQRDRYCLDEKYFKDYSFEFYLDLSVDKNYEIEFKKSGKNLDIDFSRPCNFSRVAGYAKTKKYLSILKENKITIEHKTTLKWIKQEIKTLFKMAKNRQQGYKVGIPFRIAYMLGYPFLRNKHIWFYMDRPEISDDNGMHLFKYAIDKDRDIKKYFVINKDTPDFREMQKIGNVLGFKSIKHRYLGLFVENIVNTQPDNQVVYPFWGSYPHFAGLLKSNNVFLQHGIIKDDISSWLNKTNMNLSFFLTSSPLEYESIFKYPYNYKRDVVKLLGLPRYDSLENQKDKKQIIIMPSWRRYLTRKSPDYIRNSEFFKRFNSLINNKELIKAAKEHDYEIIFRPHPKVYDFIELFDENEYVKIDYERVKYQTLFNNGSLMITDYSSVAFDFAYLYKPVLYYQYSEDYHFDLENTFFNYETMGLGEICKSEEKLVNTIIEYMENDCQIKEKYSKRIKDFYIFTDKNNCKRVYDEIKKISLKD